jgi:steroid 5-alpha reductase family enzyme
MWKTVLFLIATLILLPYFAFTTDKAPTGSQWDLIYLVGKSYLILATLCFLVSIITKNYSQVDKLWSIAPIFYAWQIAEATHFETRMVLMAVLITIWGARLTFNFARRGGYSWKFWTGEEDYRWAVLRAKPEFSSKLNWFLFNLFFISFYQMGLVLIIVFPMIKASGNSGLQVEDFVLTVIVLFWVVYEFIADQQQYNFQEEKHRRMKNKESLGEFAHGFTNTGLWGISRHPNYLAEQATWVSLYLFSVIATESWVNWSIVGCVLLIFLFWGSSNFSEEITASKYPAYKDYQKKVGRFFPKLF